MNRIISLLVNNVLKPFRFTKGVFRELKRLFYIVRSENYRFLQVAPPGHFYSTIPDTKEICLNSKFVFDLSAMDIPGVDINENAQLELAQAFIDFYSELPFPDKKIDDCRYYYDNQWFSYGDAISLYSIMRIFKPRRVVEVGSGYSSAAMLDIDEQFFDNQIEFVFIEPHPARLNNLLQHKDRKRIRIFDKPVQKAPTDFFLSLCENDILFIDSSHVAKMYSDVNCLIHNVMPLLSKGVLIHFHDILWPFEYPKSWFNFGIAWNEAYIVRAFMQYNSLFEIVFFNSLMELRHDSFLEANLPLMLKKPSSKLTQGNSSLWIRKVG